MMNRKVLYDTKWLQLLELSDPEIGVEGYICSHAEWANGRAVAVLPYRSTPHSDQLLVRHELVPCWSSELSPCSITGGMDVEGESPLACAMRELEEETGYTCADESKWDYLGKSYLNKASTTTLDLYAVDLTGLEPGEIQGDGTSLEEKATCEWVDDITDFSRDPLLEAMVYRLIRKKF